MRRTSHASSTLASVLILVLVTLAGIAAFPGTARGGGPDSDGDGIPDDTDNCVNVANADQCDTDGDGFGNMCDADLNNDGIVNFIDFGLLKAAMFTQENPDADLNCDGLVNFVDLGLLKNAFFKPPG
jgi:hypothetical protein